MIYLDTDRDANQLAAALAGYVARGQGRIWPQNDRKNAPMHFQEFGTGAQILRDLGLRRLRVMTNQPLRLRGVSGYGLEIVEWIPVDGRTETELAAQVGAP